MKRSIGIVILSFYIFPLLSQEKRDSLIYKNEIGINVVPLIGRLALNEKYRPYEYRLQFKRFLTSKFVYRSSYSILLNRNYGQKTVISYSVPITDSTLYVYYSINDYRPEFNVAQGLEYRWGRKKVKCFAGADFTFSNSGRSYLYESGERFLLRESGENVQSTPGPPLWEWPAQRKNDTLFTSSKTRVNSFGIKLVAGVQFHFTKHFYFSVQTGLWFRYSYSKTNYSVYHKMPSSKTESYNGPDKFQDIPLSLINDFSLFYRF